MSCLTSSPFTFECVKQDFGHLPNKSLLKQGKLLLLLIFLFFPVKYGSTKHWLSQVHTYMAETKGKKTNKTPTKRLPEIQLCRKFVKNRPFRQLDNFIYIDNWSVKYGGNFGSCHHSHQVLPGSQSNHHR